MTASVAPPPPDAAAAGAATDIFLTVDQLMEQAHLALDAVADPASLEVDTMTMLAGASPPDDATIARIRGVIEKGRRTGRILDSFEERRAAQKELDYLAKILERFGLSFQETTLVAFDAEALRAVAVPAYPFEDAQDQQRVQPAPSREQLHDYLWRHLDGAYLRCDRSVLDSLTSQLAGDPEAWALLDFTLRRMYAELQRDGAGNKLQWPKAVATDCRTLLAETARQTYENCPKAGQDALRKILVKLGMNARRHTGRQDFSDFEGIELAEGEGAKRALGLLVQQGLVLATDAVSRKRRWRFVHRSLQERWGELQRWVDAEQTARRQRLSLVFWTSLVIAVCAVVTAAGFGLYKQQLEKADALAGSANVRLSTVKTGDPESENALLNEVQRAYRGAATPIAYVALFNAVNRVAHARAPVSAQIMNSYITTFGREPGDPVMKLSIPAQQDFIPGKLTGSPVATAFSPAFDRVAIVHAPRKDSDEVWLNIYQWGVAEPVYSGPPCPTAHSGRGAVRLSYAGRYYAIECTSATDSVVGAVDPEDEKRVKRMFEIVGAQKLAEERFPFFSGEGPGEVHMITVSIAGELKVRPLDGHGENDSIFRIPMLAAITPMDTSYDHRGNRIAVLDRQGVVAIYGQPNWFARYINPRDEAPAILYINANDNTYDNNLTWQPIGVEFLPSGKCLRVRRMAIDHDMVANGFIQHYWDELYVIDADTLLDIAARMVADERIGQMPCASEPAR